MTEKLRIALCIPTSGTCKSWFAYSVAQLLIAAPTMLNEFRRDADIEIVLGMLESSVVHANREKLADQALEAKCTHLLFADDDMVFEPLAVAIMLGRRQALVGCNYPMRGWPITFTAVGLDGKRMLTTSETRGLEEVSYTGFGLALIETEVFAKTPKPWFLPVYTGEIYTTEDSPFYERARKVGFRAFVDHDASKLLEHLGAHKFKWDQYREPEKKPEAEILPLRKESEK